MRAFARLFVDQPDAFRLQPRERGADVVDAEREVVQAGTALGDVFRDRRVFGSRPSNSIADSPAGMKCARTRCDATSSGASTSRPSASR